MKANSPQSSYLCIEWIPSAIWENLGVWQATAMSGHYKLWNTVVRDCPQLYESANSGREIYVKVS